MEFNWEEYKNAYKNEQEARTAFVSLCDILMQKLYPEYSIKNADQISESDNKRDHSLGKKCIVYLPKYFLDGVSNSRKGQIRKSLNDHLSYMKANKITQWVLLLPYTFSEEERSWWENWSLRIKQENGITPYVLLGNPLEGFPNSIPELVSKFHLDFVGFESIKAAEEESKKDDSSDSSDDTMLGFFGMDDSDEEAATDESSAEESSGTTIEFVDETQTEEVKTGTAQEVKVETAQEVKTDTAQEASDKAVSVANDIVEAVTEDAQRSHDKTAEEKVDSIAKTVNIVVESLAKSNADNNVVSELQDVTSKAQQSSAQNVSEAAKIVSDTVSQSAATRKAATSSVAEPTLEQLENTYEFKTNFEALETEKLELPTDDDDNQRAVFDKRRENSSVKNYLNDFVFGDLSQFKGADLVKKAQIYVTNEQFSRGLYIYEYAKAKGLIDSNLETSYERGVSECRFQLNFKYYMIKGDLLFSQHDYINAAETYKKACDVIDYYREMLKEYEDQINNSFTSSTSLLRNYEATVKYLEANGESLLQVGEFSKAVDNFDLALQYDPANEGIKKRREIASYLEKGTTPSKHKWLSWLTIFTAPWYYFKARSMDPNIKELKNAEKLRNKAIIGLAVALLIIAAVAWLIWGTHKVITEPASESDKIMASSSATPLSLQIQKGDYYMSKISADNPHFIDSAIAAYERAIRIDNTDTVAENGYRKATIERANYITIVQQNISTDSADYFLSMRRPTEGLRLFKYKYDPNDPSKGKFGFVDTNGVVKIAPMYDFNYRTMDEQGETFYNGRAKVCLKVGDNDTVYFYIDQHGNKIDE